MKIETWMRLRRFVVRLPKPRLLRACYRLLKSLYALNRKPQTPKRKVEMSLRLCEAIQRIHGGLAGKACLEVGPGVRINLPIVLWLMGAERVLSVDLKRALNPSHIAADIDYYRAHRQWVVANLLKLAHGVEGGEAATVEEAAIVARLDRLLALHAASCEELVEQVLALTNITYLAPADAGELHDIPCGVFDLHVSSHALEHASPESLRRILGAAARLLKPDGILAASIDHTDHLSHVNHPTHRDPTISKINFLRYDDEQWNQIAVNLDIDTNRLRASEYLPIFQDSGFDLIEIQNTVDDACVNLIKTKTVPLAEKFRGMDIADLATTSSIVVATPRR